MLLAERDAFGVPVALQAKAPTGTPKAPSAGRRQAAPRRPSRVSINLNGVDAGERAVRRPTAGSPLPRAHRLAPTLPTGKNLWSSWR
jgi:hypothetical protein